MTYPEYLSEYDDINLILSQARTKKKVASMKRKRITADIIIYIVLTIMAVLWLVPLFFLVLQSVSVDTGAYVRGMFFPQPMVEGGPSITFKHYVNLLTTPFYTSGVYFYQWWLNSFVIAIGSCIITTVITLAVSYAFSRLRFASRKPIMNVMLIIGMFPGFMGMIAVYELLKLILPDAYDSMLALILVYSAGAASGYYISKGFFDTVSKSLDEAAKIDGASQAMIFWKIIIPLSKPIIVYTILMSFTSPWGDYIFASFIMMNSHPSSYTVAVAMKKILEKLGEGGDNVYFAYFCCSSVIVATPIVILFFFLQKYYVEGITGGAVKG